MRTSIGRSALFLCCAATCVPAPVAADTTVDDPSCELQAPTYDSRQVVCSLPGSATSRRYRLQIDFSGGHDDTVARIIATTLNDVPFTCEPSASKTQLQGEDGDVSLSCSFGTPASTAGASSTIAFRWNHAQYVGYSFRAVP